MSSLDVLLDSPLGPVVQPFLAVPELRSLLEEAADDLTDPTKMSRWTPDYFAMRLRATGWWKETSAVGRQYDLSSPADQKLSRDEAKARLQAELEAQYGLDYISAHPELLNSVAGWAEQVASGKMPMEVFQQKILMAALKIPGTAAWEMRAAERRRKQEPENIAEEFKQTASQDYYLGAMKDEVYRKWADQVHGGTTSEADFHEYLKNEALKQMPSLMTGIKQGFTPRELLGPAMDTVTRELGVDEATFMNNKGWFDEFKYRTRNQGAEDIDWVKFARTRSGWASSQNGRQMSANFVGELLRKFGATA